MTACTDADDARVTGGVHRLKDSKSQERFSDGRLRQVRVEVGFFCRLVETSFARTQKGGHKKAGNSDEEQRFCTLQKVAGQNGSIVDIAGCWPVVGRAASRRNAIQLFRGKNPAFQGQKCRSSRSGGEGPMKTDQEKSAHFVSTSASRPSGVWPFWTLLRWSIECKRWLSVGISS